MKAEILCGFYELTNGRKFHIVLFDSITYGRFLPGKDFRMSIIGTSIPRVDAFAKATGAARYTADYIVPGMLRVALARAAVAHARIRAIECPPLPEGVFCFTAADLASNLIPSIKSDQPVLAFDKIRFAGEPYAIVAADTRERAEDYAKKIRLICDPLPVVDDAEAALKDDAPLIFESGNLCSSLHSRKGDPEGALADCALVVEDRFSMPMQTHGFLETESAFTRIDEQGRLALISSTQNPFEDRALIARTLGLPLETVNSKAATVGGAFGGKDGNTAQIFPAIVTHFTRRPAQYIYSREEHIRWGMKRHSADIRLRLGFDEDGRMQAFLGNILMDTGAYGLLGPAVLELGTEQMTGPYYCPNILLDGLLAYTNHTPASAMRGFGGPQSALAVETLIDRAAGLLGLTPIEIRRRNALHQNQSGPMGANMDYSFGFEESLDLLEQTDLYQEMLHHPEPGCGYGIAAAIKSSGMGKGVPDNAICEIERLPDGRFRVRIGLPDIGQGGETANVMMAAEALHVAPEQIEMHMADTDGTLECGSTAASRCTYVCGNAIVKAAQDILAGKDYARAEAVFPEVPDVGVPSIFASLAELAKVRVDPVTGAVQVCDVVNVTETGRVIHPAMLDGQIFGGIVMSVGYALSEQIRCQNGHTLEDSFASYIMPTALDAPRMVNVNAPVIEESGPFGAKGMAEASTIAIVPAITNALHQLCPALNIRMLPIDREEVLRCLGKERV